MWGLQRKDTHQEEGGGKWKQRKMLGWAKNEGHALMAAAENGWESGTWGECCWIEPVVRCHWDQAMPHWSLVNFCGFALGMECSDLQGNWSANAGGVSIWPLGCNILSRNSHRIWAKQAVLVVTWFRHSHIQEACRWLGPIRSGIWRTELKFEGWIWALEVRCRRQEGHASRLQKRPYEESALGECRYRRTGASMELG